MLDIFLDALIDSVKLLPFLFITYVLMELLEHKAGGKTKHIVANAGKIGPLWGGILGIFPQCGFSAAASGLYAGRVITLGTLMAIFLSTSDEMLPIFISQSVNIVTILKILGAKALIGAVSGVLIDIIYTRIVKKNEHEHIHEICEHDHCKCEKSILLSSFKHTVKVFVFIFAVSFVINILVSVIGENRLSEIFVNVPVVGELIAALVGLIPNCVASVVITELYLNGIISAGAMMSGLLVSAGVGVLVLFRTNRHIKENICIMGILYSMSVLWGVLIEFCGITF